MTSVTDLMLRAERALVRAGDCPACTDQLRHDLTEEKDRALVGEALS